MICIKFVVVFLLISWVLNIKLKKITVITKEKQVHVLEKNNILFIKYEEKYTIKVSFTQNIEF